MARIKIHDLPEDQKLSREELKKVHGGNFLYFDQKANQLYNILSTVQKSMSEMEDSVIRNIT